MRSSKFITKVGSLAVAAVCFFLLENAGAQSCNKCLPGDQKATTRINISNDTNYCASHCTEFSACSIDRDLSGASGEELERYKAEKAQDGQTFSDWTAPDFTVPTTGGERLSLSDYRGRPVLLIFMSGHCSHCLDSHKILPELQAKYESSGLAVLPVYINSGSVEDVHDWSKYLDINYPILVSQSRDLSRLYKSRMVPTFFLIDREGKITRKFVGYKSKATLDQALAELVRKST